MKIVIVEDDKDIASFLELAVQNLGYETAVAHDGQSGLSLIQKTRPNLILLDLHLPEVSGNEILRRVRADDALHSVPVIVLTGESYMLKPAVEAQANFTLVKPIDVRVLSQLISQIDPV
jgi:DNA-binding response OmpR family regulator